MVALAEVNIALPEAAELSARRIFDRNSRTPSKLLALLLTLCHRHLTTRGGRGLLHIGRTMCSCAVAWAVAIVSFRRSPLPRVARRDLVEVAVDGVTDLVRCVGVVEVRLRVLGAVPEERLPPGLVCSHLSPVVHLLLEHGTDIKRCNHDSDGVPRKPPFVAPLPVRVAAPVLIRLAARAVDWVVRLETRTGVDGGAFAFATEDQSHVWWLQSYNTENQIGEYAFLYMISLYDFTIFSASMAEPSQS